MCRLHPLQSVSEVEQMYQLDMHLYSSSTTVACFGVNTLLPVKCNKNNILQIILKLPPHKLHKRSKHTLRMYCKLLQIINAATSLL